MVEMLVAVQQDLHVAEPEPEAADVAGDGVRTAFGAAVDQYVAVLPGDQDRRNTAGPDHVGTAENAYRRRRLVEVVPLLARRGISRPCDLDRSDRLFNLTRRRPERNHNLLRGGKKGE